MVLLFAQRLPPLVLKDGVRGTQRLYLWYGTIALGLLTIADGFSIVPQTRMRGDGWGSYFLSKDLFWIPMIAGDQR